MSAYAHIFGEFNYSATPLLPPGTKVIAHHAPEDRATWDLNGETGWYIGPSMQHNRCVKFYFPISRRVRDIPKLEIISHAIPIPEVKLKDHLRQAASDIVSLLQTPPSITSMSLEAGDPTRNALVKIAGILQREEKIPELTTNDPLASTALQTDLLSRVKSHRLKAKVSFNPSKNITHQIEPINSTVPSESMQESATVVAANIFHQHHATLPRVKKEKVGIEINDTSTMQQKMDQAINQLISKYC